jgi:hypothetical protein
VIILSVKYENQEYKTVLKKNLLTLDLSGKGIRSITEIEGLDALSDLQVLNLSSNKIAEIKGLDYLIHLMELDFSDNQINEIKGLSHLIRLKKLKLENNKFITIKGLENLINLKNLSLGAKYMLVDEDGKLRENSLLTRAFRYEFKQRLILNGKVLEGLEEKIALSSAKYIVAYCRVALKQSGNTQRLVPADVKMVKLEEKLEKELRKDEKMKEKIEKSKRARKSLSKSMTPERRGWRL